MKASIWAEAAFAVPWEPSDSNSLVLLDVFLMMIVLL